MKAQELRIGNLIKVGVKILTIHSIHVVNDSNEAHVRVTGFVNGSYCFDLSEIEPISLSDEILLKSNFNYFKHDGIVPLGEHKVQGGNDGDTHEWAKKVKTTKSSDIGGDFAVARWGNEGEPFYYLNYGIKIEIQYLHQLQNLYFMLTGEELNIQL